MLKSVIRPKELVGIARKTIDDVIFLFFYLKITPIHY